MLGKVNPATIVMIFITLLIGVSLLPTFAQETGVAQGDGNITGAACTMTGLLPLFYVLILVMAGLAYIKFGR